MPAPRVLLVKLSSLGDVVHLLPAVTDLRAHEPDIQIDWAVEEAYAPLVQLHPAVTRAIPVALRRVRSSPLAPSSWATLPGLRRALRATVYDWIIDAQGLLKSVAVARLARGPLFGFDRRSVRERLAASFYDQDIAVTRSLHAAERCRRLVAAVFGYRPEGLPRYGLVAPRPPPAWAPPRGYIVALHAASRPEKCWSEAHWLDLAGRAAREGIAVVYPGGTPAERAVAARLAKGSPGAVAAPAMTLPEAAALLGHARAVVGVDTGLTHLAVALGTPAVGIYTATRPGLTGLFGGDNAVNLGGPGRAPSAAMVAQTLFGSAAA